MPTGVITLTTTDVSTATHVILLHATGSQSYPVFIRQGNTPARRTAPAGARGRAVREPRSRYSDVYETMLASEELLRRDWDTPEEDAAWASL